MRFISKIEEAILEDLHMLQFTVTPALQSPWSLLYPIPIIANAHKPMPCGQKTETSKEIFFPAPFSLHFCDTVVSLTGLCVTW